ncbi:MAG: GNAT family N-acetyltransferase [Eubacteriales bacterium]|nr:GNAT family N-acetyltransferase [Eubacteriales bacterium]
MNALIDTSKMRLETDRLILRGFCEDDLDDFFEYASVPGVGEMAGWPHHENIETSQMILKSFIEEREVFAIWHKDTGKVIGSLGLHYSWANDDPRYAGMRSKEIGYVIARDHWGQGLVPEAVRAVITMCFQKYDCEVLTCGHFRTNSRSKRVIEKSGFRFYKQSVFHAKQLGMDYEDMKYVLLRSEWEDARRRFGEKQDMICHYDELIEENNDPAHDPEPLRAYMDKWDGEGFIEALQLDPNKSVLEIGVGTGRLALRVCGKCRSFTGIDISPKTIERARQNLQKFSNIHLICGDYLTCQFDGSFDVIYSSLTFMHIEEKRAAIQKTAGLLTPGGRFVLSTSKNRQPEIDYGTRKVKVYPDDPDEICLLLTEAGLTLKKQFETEFAVVFVAQISAVPG